MHFHNNANNLTVSYIIIRPTWARFENLVFVLVIKGVFL